MLHVPVGANAYGLTSPSWGTARPAAANGTAVTPGSSVKGAYAQVIAATARDAYGILVNINSNSGSATSRNTIVDIGVDESGGTSYAVEIPDLLVGGSSPHNVGAGGSWYYFPVFIPAGSRVAARAAGSVTNAIRVGCVLFMAPSNPAMIRKGSFVEAIGISGLTGTTVAFGTTAEGAWTLIGTTSRRLWWWQAAVQLAVADTAWTSNAIHLDVAVGDGTSFDVIISDLLLTTSTAEQMGNPPLTAGVEWDVPSGSSIYVRGRTSGNLDSYSAAVYGLGG